MPPDGGLQVSDVVADLWARERRYTRHCRDVAVQSGLEGELHHAISMHVRQRIMLLQLEMWWVSLVPDGVDCMTEVAYQWVFTLLLERILPPHVYPEVQHLVQFDFVADCSGGPGVMKNRFFGALVFLAVFFAPHTSLMPLEFTKLMHRNIFDAPDAVMADGGLLILKRVEALRMRCAKNIVDAVQGRSSHALLHEGGGAEARALYSAAMDAHHQSMSTARPTLSEQVKAILQFVRGSGVREKQVDEAKVGLLLSSAAVDAAATAMYYTFDLLLAGLQCERGFRPDNPDALFSPGRRARRTIKRRAASVRAVHRMQRRSLGHRGGGEAPVPSKSSLPGLVSSKFDEFMTWSPREAANSTSTAPSAPPEQLRYPIGGSKRWSFPEEAFHRARPQTAKAKLLQTVLHNRSTHNTVGVPPSPSGGALTPQRPSPAPVAPRANRERLMQDPRLFSEGFYAFKQAKLAKQLEDAAAILQADRVRHNPTYEHYRRWQDQGAARVHAYRCVKQNSA